MMMFPKSNPMPSKDNSAIQEVVNIDQWQEFKIYGKKYEGFG
jgi:hypothetical protein